MEEKLDIWWLNEESEQMLNRGYLLKGETVEGAIDRITTAAAKRLYKPELQPAFKEMITKENNILFPLLKEQLTEEDFKQIGQMLSNPDAAVYVEKKEDTEGYAIDNIEGNIPMSMGVLSAVEANAIFK